MYGYTYRSSKAWNHRNTAKEPRHNGTPIRAVPIIPIPTIWSIKIRDIVCHAMRHVIIGQQDAGDWGELHKSKQSSSAPAVIYLELTQIV